MTIFANLARKAKRNSILMATPNYSIGLITSRARSSRFSSQKSQVGRNQDVTKIRLMMLTLVKMIARPYAELNSNPETH